MYGIAVAIVGSLEAGLLRGSRGQGQDSHPQDRAEPLRLLKMGLRKLLHGEIAKL